MKEKIEVLMAMMNISSKEALPDGIKQLEKSEVPCLGINQCTEIEPEFEMDQDGMKIISVASKGLSKSRNLALKHMRCGYGLFADADISFIHDFDKVIKDAFKTFPTADIITFQSLNEEGSPRKNYPSKSCWHDKTSIMKVSSIEIAFKRNSIMEAGICFDERFGLGSKYQTGEENIFLADALDKGLKLWYVPEPITCHPKDSTGRDLGKNKVLIKSKGAMIQRIFPRTASLIGLGFALKKWRQSDLTLLRFMRHLMEGMSEFKRLGHES